jgi:hypothetical protein
MPAAIVTLAAVHRLLVLVRVPLLRCASDMVM